MEVPLYYFIKHLGFYNANLILKRGTNFCYVAY